MHGFGRSFHVKRLDGTTYFDCMNYVSLCTECQVEENLRNVK